MFHHNSIVMSLVGLLLVFSSLVFSSEGDRDFAFGNCVKNCLEKGLCKHDLSLALQVLFWDCRADCNYLCTHSVTRDRKEKGFPLVQYYGKWPFYRFLGLQEPASVVFSLLNGWAHYRGLQRIRAEIHQNYEFRRFIITLPFIGMNLWLWSSVFHSRDTRWTEKMDYFSAMLYVLFNTYLCFLRVFGLVVPANRSTMKLRLAKRILELVLVGFFIAHISYLSFWSFDYGYNMAANVTVGIIHTFVWIVWAVRHVQKNGKEARYAYKQVIMVVLLALSMSLELLDFPPLWLTFDAHSLWHLSTIPITFILYDFLVSDSQFVYRIRKGKFVL